MSTRPALRRVINPDRIVLEPAFENVAAARRFVVDRLEGLELNAELIDDLRLATSELVTNAVEHGEARPVVVELGVDSDVVSLSVTSHSRGDAIGPVSDWAVAGAAEVAGRGLGIVRSLADEVAVSRGDGCLTITVARQLN